MERVDTKFPQIQFEAKLYNYLNNDSMIPDKGIPKAHFYGSEPPYNYLIMDLLGKSLEDLLAKCPGSKMSLKTVLMLAD